MHKYCHIILFAIYFLKNEQKKKKKKKKIGKWLYSITL